VYKAAPTKKPHVDQTYYVGGLTVVIYKDKTVMIGYSTTNHNTPYRMNYKKDTKESEFYRNMVKKHVILKSDYP